MVDDSQLCGAFDLCAKIGAVAQVHAGLKKKIQIFFFAFFKNGSFNLYYFKKKMVNWFIVNKRESLIWELQVLKDMHFPDHQDMKVKPLHVQFFWHMKTIVHFMLCMVCLSFFCQKVLEGKIKIFDKKKTSRQIFEFSYEQRRIGCSR